MILDTERSGDTGFVDRRNSRESRARRRRDEESSSAEESGSETSGGEAEYDSCYDDEDSSNDGDRGIEAVCNTVNESYSRYRTMMHDACSVMNRQLDVIRSIMLASVPSLMDVFDSGASVKNDNDDQTNGSDSDDVDTDTESQRTA